MALWEIELDFPQFKNVAVQIQSELPGLIAATLQTQRAMIFDSEGSYNGRPGWEPLKHRKGQILSDSGDLRKSMGPMNDGTAPGHAAGSIVQLAMGLVTIGTNIRYAEIHDQGATIPGHASKTFHSLKTGRFIKHSRKRGIWKQHYTDAYDIPARPFGNFTSEDISELNETVTNYLTSKING
jgi:phage gpG-like protein